MEEAQPLPAYGVHRRYGADPRALTASLCDAGWRVFLLGRATDKEGFFAQAAASLPLDPPVQSPNWDAFNDSLGGGIIKRGEPAVAVVWEDANALAKWDADAFSVAYQILADAVFVLADPRFMRGRTTRLLVLLT